MQNAHPRHRPDDEGVQLSAEHVGPGPYAIVNDRVTPGNRVTLFFNVNDGRNLVLAQFP